MIDKLLKCKVLGRLSTMGSEAWLKAGSFDKEIFHRVVHRVDVDTTEVAPKILC
jgi:hypothetical protein